MQFLNIYMDEETGICESEKGNVNSERGVDNSGYRVVLASLTIIGIFVANKFGYISLGI